MPPCILFTPPNMLAANIDGRRSHPITGVPVTANDIIAPPIHANPPPSIHAVKYSLPGLTPHKVVKEGFSETALIAIPSLVLNIKI